MSYFLTLPSRILLTIFATALSPFMAIILAVFQTELAKEYPRVVKEWIDEIWK